MKNNGKNVFSRKEEKGMKKESKDVLQKERHMIEQARDGNEKAKVELFNMVDAMVVRLVSKFCGNKREWEDAIQSGRMGIAEAIKRFDHRKEVKWITYATYWIKCYILEEVKRKKQPPVDTDSYSLERSYDPNPHDHLILNEDKTRLRRAIKTLSQEEQDIVRMRWQEELTFDEIGDILGMGGGSVEWRQKKDSKRA